MDVQLHGTNKITQLFPEILVFSYFGECWVCLGMPDHGYITACKK